MIYLEAFYIVCLSPLNLPPPPPSQKMVLCEGLGKGAFRIRKGDTLPDLYETFIALKVTFHKGDLSVVKVL